MALPKIMTTDLLLELFAGFLTAIIALWIVLLNRNTISITQSTSSIQFKDNSISNLSKTGIVRFVSNYFSDRGMLVNLGILALRITVGAMMIHHGQEKLADPQTFASNYVIPLHIPFPIFFAYLAGYSEVIGSWMLILGIFTPVGALALIATMAVAAYHHILFSGLNIYALELVVLYLGSSIALLLVGPGRLSFDAGIFKGIMGARFEKSKDLPSIASENPIYASNAT